MEQVLPGMTVGEPTLAQQNSYAFLPYGHQDFLERLSQMDLPTRCTEQVAEEIALLRASGNCQQCGDNGVHLFLLENSCLPRKRWPFAEEKECCTCGTIRVARTGRSGRQPAACIQ